jgi:integrase
MQSSGCKDRVLKVRTADLYHSLLRNHLLPAFRDVRLNDIDEAAIRRWRKERLDTGSRGQRRFGPITVAKAYRLLHAIFETAVADQMVRRNPCRIEGAGKEDSPEREVVSLPVVFAIADALPVRYRAMALLATFVSMRWGELVGLRRENIDLGAC